MQAPLSSTASGKSVDTASSHAVLTTAALHTLDNLFHPQPLPQVGSYLSASAGKDFDGVAEGVGLAHDAGNLLGALGLYSQLLARPGVLREEHRHYAEELQMLSGRSRELIDRLLDPATTERRAMGDRRTIRKQSPTAGSGREIEDHQVVVPEVIERCRGLLNTIARRAIEVTYEAGAKLPVSVPHEALERILVNLTKNAAEATEGEGAITLRVSCRASRISRGDGEARRIVLTVEDKGRGMSVAAVKVLLGEAGPKVVGARGIGFQVVRELVGVTGGQLRLESQSGCGTTVRIDWAVAAKTRTESCAYTIPADLLATGYVADGYVQPGSPADSQMVGAPFAPEIPWSGYVPTSITEQRGLLLMMPFEGDAQSPIVGQTAAGRSGTEAGKSALGAGQRKGTGRWSC